MCTAAPCVQLPRVGITDLETLTEGEEEHTTDEVSTQVVVTSLTGADRGTGWCTPECKYIGCMRRHVVGVGWLW